MPNKRVLLKLSGEILAGPKSKGIDGDACLQLAHSLKTLKSHLDIGIVIGGGNFFRGKDAKDIGLERVVGDQIGMLATIMNGAALQNTLEKIGCPSVLMSGLACPQVAESYTWRGAIARLQEGKLVIFVGGTGNSHFTTDTAAALRASEIHAELFLKATKVDGVYNKDPLKNPDAKLYKTISYSQFLQENLKVMDATAISLCQSTQIPILVFNMNKLFSKDVLKIGSHESGTIIAD